MQNNSNNNQGNINKIPKMFDLSLTEIAVIAAVALLVIRPDDLPEVMRAVGKIVGKIKKMATDVRKYFSDTIGDETIKEVHGELKKIPDMNGNLLDAYDISDLKELDTSRKNDKTPPQP